MTRRLVLASASPARLRLLQAAGLCPEVVVSGVDEQHDLPEGPEAQALVLARRKATAVAATLPVGDALVVGCDSILEVDGEAHGKPSTPQEAITRWRRLRGRQAVLCTGHCVVDTAAGLEVSASATTTVRFGSPSDAELEAYVATGEPLRVAGAFTLDGYAAPFIDGVDGDPGNVIGLSLPLLRSLLHRLDVEITDLWH